MNTDKISKIKSIIDSARMKNRFVSVDFIKKSTGELRRMTLGRNRALETGVKDISSESTDARRWTLNSRGMIVVEELTSGHTAQWRTIPLENVTRIKADGVETVF